jgi:flagellar motor switch protein FliN/FliY
MMAEEEVKDAAAQAPALEASGGDVDLDSISDIPVEISAVLGSVKMPVSQLLKLGRGAVVKLNRKVGEPIDIYVNERLVARGEIVIVENRIGVTMTEIIRSEKE